MVSINSLDNLDSNIFITSFYYFGLYSICSSILIRILLSNEYFIDTITYLYYNIALYNILTNIKAPNCSGRIGLRKIRIVR